MKKIVVMTLVFLSVGCGRKGYYTSTPIPSNNSKSAKPVNPANCTDAVNAKTNELKAEADNTITNSAICVQDNTYTQKYKGLVCDFPANDVAGEPAASSVTIPSTPCDETAINTLRIAYFKKIGKPFPVSAPAPASD